MSRLVSASRVATLLGTFDRSPAYRGLAEGLRVLITDGRVPVGVRLPSERELTDALAVSRTTVTRAYAELRDHGFLVSRQGSGSIASLPASRGHRGDHLLPPGDLPEDKIDLTCAAPVPGPGVLGAYERAVTDLPAYLGGTGYYPSGLPILRETVAASYAARGLPTSPEQVMVVPGALAGVAIAARALLATGDRAVTESPTYPNAIATLTHSGARVVGVDVPRNHADTEALTTTLRQVVPRVAYLIPDFHNPTGTLMPEEGRADVAEALARTRTTAIIDESMVALALDGQEMPRPFAANLSDTVSVGSLSKPFWGGLRIGWIRVPSDRMDAFFKARLSLDLGAPLLEQLVATDLLRDGGDLLAAPARTAAHVPRRRAGRGRAAPPRLAGGAAERRPQPLVRAARRGVLRPGRPRRTARRAPRRRAQLRPRGRPGPVPPDSLHPARPRAHRRHRPPRRRLARDPRRSGPWLPHDHQPRRLTPPPSVHVTFPRCPLLLG